jgi:hypothetical protein
VLRYYLAVKREAQIYEIKDLRSLSGCGEAGIDVFKLHDFWVGSEDDPWIAKNFNALTTPP